MHKSSRRLPGFHSFQPCLHLSITPSFLLHHVSSLSAYKTDLARVQDFTPLLTLNYNYISICLHKTHITGRHAYTSDESKWWRHVYNPTMNHEVTLRICCTGLELRRAVKLIFNCSRIMHTHRHAVMYNVSLDFCTMSQRLSSSHLIFFVNISHNVLSWLNVRLLHHGYLTEWTTERGNDRKRETERKTGRSSDSEP